MGMEVIMKPKEGPHFPKPLRSPDDGQYKEVLERDVDVKTELDYVYKAITMTRQKLEGRVPLIGFCGAPWTLLCYMVEGGGTKLFKEVKTWIFKYPQASKDMLQKISELCVEYLALQVVAGAQVLHPCIHTRWIFCLHMSADDSGIRLMGRRAFTIILQGICAAIPALHMRPFAEPLEGAEARSCAHDRIR